MLLGKLIHYVFRYALPQFLDSNIEKLLENQSKGIKTISQALRESFVESLYIVSIWCTKEPLQSLKKLFSGDIVRDLLSSLGKEIYRSFESSIKILTSIKEESFQNFLWEETKKNLCQEYKQKLLKEIKLLLSEKDRIFPELELASDCKLYSVIQDYLPVEPEQEKQFSQRLAMHCYQILKQYPSEEFYLPAFLKNHSVFVEIMREIFYCKAKYNQELCNILNVLGQENSLRLQEKNGNNIKKIIEFLLASTEKKEGEDSIAFLKNILQSPKKEEVSFDIKRASEEEISQKLHNIEEICQPLLPKDSLNVIPLVEFCPLLLSKDRKKINDLEYQVQESISSIPFYHGISWKQQQIEQGKRMSSLTHITASLLYTGRTIECIRRAIFFYEKSLDICMDTMDCAVLHFNLFLCYLQCNDFEKAQEHLCQAIALNPKRFAPFDLKKFQLLQILGYGLTGILFKVIPVKDTLDSSPACALKTIWYEQNGKEREEEFFQNSLRQEIRCLKKIAENIASKNIKNSKVIRYLEEGEYSSRPYLLMEYFDGKNLFEWIEIVWKGTPVFYKAIPILYQLASAIYEIYSCGIAHLDIKPGNVLYNEKTGEIRLIDFGIARRSLVQEEYPTDHHLTTLSLALAYSLDFASPEQKHHAVQCGLASDIYSFAKTACYLLTKSTETGAIQLRLKHESFYAEWIKKLNELIDACVVPEVDTESPISLKDVSIIEKGIFKSRRLNNINQIVETIQEISIEIFEQWKENFDKELIQNALLYYQSLSFFPVLLQKILETKIKEEEKFDIFTNFLLKNPSENSFCYVLDVLQKWSSFPEKQYQFIHQYISQNSKSLWAKKLLLWAQEMEIETEWKVKLLRKFAFEENREENLIKELMDSLDTLNMDERQKYCFWIALMERYPEQKILENILLKVTQEYIKFLKTLDDRLSLEGILFYSLHHLCKKINTPLENIFKEHILKNLEKKWQETKEQGMLMADISTPSINQITK